MTLADSAGAVAAFLTLPPGATTATIESKTNFIRPLREGTLTARAEVLSGGRSTIVVHTRIHDAAGKLVAATTQTQAVIGP